jgi:transcriptional regulator with XRE-family HTH domain
VETRREEVGRQIKTRRRLAKFRSQRAFAEAIGVGESGVANAERGSDRVGDGPIYEAIETYFGWPVGSITAYIAGTGQAPWSGQPEATANEEEPADPADDWTSEEIERVRGMSNKDIIAEGQMIGRFSGEDAQTRYLWKAFNIKMENRVKPTA